MMKKLSIALLVILLFNWSCQRRNHIQHIPPPNYKYFDDQSKTLLSSKQEISITEKQNETPLQTDPGILTATADNDLTIFSTSQKEVYPVIKKNSTTSVVAKKPSFKERALKKIVARKVQKATAGKRAQSDSLNTMALLAGIFGILSIVLFWLTFVLGIVFAIASIILGFIGKKQVSEGNGTGRGWAITGIVLGAVTIFLTAIFMIIIMIALL